MYEISYSVQTESDGPGEIDLWIKKNGVDLVRKDRIKTLEDGLRYMPSTPYLLILEAQDYLELFFASSNICCGFVSSNPSHASLTISSSLFISLSLIHI